MKDFYFPSHICILFEISIMSTGTFVIKRKRKDTKPTIEKV